jgi:hypothetical protein
MQWPATNLSPFDDSISQHMCQFYKWLKIGIYKRMDIGKHEKNISCTAYDTTTETECFAKSQKLKKLCRMC